MIKVNVVGAFFGHYHWVMLKFLSRLFHMYSAVTVIAMVIVVSPAHAQEERPPLRFGIMALAPYGYQDAEGRWRGNLYEVAQAILKRGGFEGFVEVVPVPRILQPGRLDCTITASVEAMENKTTRVASLNQTMRAGVLPVEGLSLNSYADLMGPSIAVPVGANLGLPFDADTTLTKIQVRNYENAMKMLSRGRVDAAVGIINSLLFSAKKAGIEQMEFGMPLVFRDLSVNVYCDPKSSAKVHWDKVKKTVNKLVNDNEIERIFSQYR